MTFRIQNPFARSLVLIATAAIGVLVVGPSRGHAQDAAPASPAATTLKAIELPAPDVSKGLPLMQALKSRKSTREVSDRPLALQQLSALLWAADGVNRDGGERTAPSALAKYPIDIYVVLPDGTYRYESAGHRLLPVAAGDHRKQAGTQDYVYSAPVNLVYMADLKKFDDVSNLSRDDKVRWAAIEAGCLAQNVYLYCASEGLGATVRVSISAEAFGKVIQARPEQVVIVAQTVGFPKGK